MPKIANLRDTLNILSTHTGRLIAAHYLDLRTRLRITRSENVRATRGGNTRRTRVGETIRHSTGFKVTQ